MRSAILAAALLIGLASGPAMADGAAPVAAVQLGKSGGVSVQLDANSLAKLPVLEQDISFQTAKGPSSGHYKGVLLWDVFKANGVLDEAGHHDELRQVFSVTGSDGYRIDFAVGEIAPDFGNKAVMLATEVDGKAIQLPRVVVPGDKLGARNVRDVVKIELR